MEADELRMTGDSEEGSYGREWHPSTEPLISDAVLAEIKGQSTAGCLLCAFDEWGEEDWE